MFNFLLQRFPGWITQILASTQTTVLGFIIIVLFLGGAGGWWLASQRKRKRRAYAYPKKSQKTPLNYDELITDIKKRNGQTSSVLFSASSIKDLPVNIPIHVAIRLAKNHKCLLVDLDLKRNAVARVFDLEVTDINGNLKSGSYPTPLENLFIWPAHNFERLRQMNLRSLLDGAAKKYDYIIIYAPYLTTLPDRRQVAACCRRTIAFTGHNGTRLMQLLEQCNCKVVRQV